MFIRGVADRIHLLQHAYVNVYLIEDADGITLIDSGVPPMWKMLLGALRELNRPLSDVKGLIITHPHFDHMGFAARAQKELGLPVLVHEADSFIARHPYRYSHEKTRTFYPMRHPGALPVLGALWATGLGIKGIEQFQPLLPGPVNFLPGRPHVIHTPGHTDGHCVLHFPDRGAVVTGDALVTLDPYTGRKGPRIVAAGSTNRTSDALSSLSGIAETAAQAVLPGHGVPWLGGAAEAVRLARTRGAI
ncbi:MBL fold metallo-hydrolase [Arthrobacter sp. JZ12]|uniref:MBL fold metallo-hydrolase n=1 Tax=Arthrobacter sp. JZ12 TaxID=2654190 RepID=UPI002B49F8F9|nr:MBL fold metallo-hydrolase [Arthrobacter sp. JZ12]WRH24420.1 MBL fold metallo-hydrolase [Arthrobacter sp. JZ12]